eukprot:s133_g16.t2
MARRTRSTAGLAGCLKRFFMSASITAIALFLLRGALHFSGAAPDQPAEPAANGSPLPPSAPEAEIVATSAISVAPAAQFTPEASAEATRTEVATAAPVVQKKKGWELHQLPIIQGCEHCCSEDDHNAPCLDVELCAASGPEKGKYALALSHWGRPNEGMLGSIKSMRAAADLLGNTDIYMVMLETDAEQMTPKLHKIFAKWGVKLYPVKWDDWCGHQDLIRLNVLGIEGYDAVAYFDGDCEFQGDITPMMRCAATGMFLSTSGGMGESLNVGFFAVRPDKRMVDAAVYFARENAFDRETQTAMPAVVVQTGTGWGGIGWAPTGGYYVGGECGQGFFYTLFHRRAENSRRALSSVGLWETWRSGQLDRCIWNYQTNSNCAVPKKWTHPKVRVHHKPTRERGSPSECDKIKFRRRREDLLRRQSEVRPPPSAEELRLAREGKRLKHLAGLCLRAAEEASDEQTTLLLLDCDFPPVEQNIRIVEDEADGGYVLLKQGGRCAHAEGDEDPEMAPSEPKLGFPVDCASTAAHVRFRKLPSTAKTGSFVLQHDSRRCVHPYEGAVNPREKTDLILHPDCDQNRPALAFLEEPNS